MAKGINMPPTMAARGSFVFIPSEDSFVFFLLLSVQLLFIVVPVEEERVNLFWKGLFLNMLIFSMTTFPRYTPYGLWESPEGD